MPAAERSWRHLDHWGLPFEGSPYFAQNGTHATFDAAAPCLPGLEHQTERLPDLFQECDGKAAEKLGDRKLSVHREL